MGAAEGILSPEIQFASTTTRANCKLDQRFKSRRIWIVSETVIVSGWLAMGVDDVGRIPGSFPPAGRLPSPAVAGARDAPITMRQTVRLRR